MAKGSLSRNRAVVVPAETPSCPLRLCVAVVCASSGFAVRPAKIRLHVAIVLALLFLVQSAAAYPSQTLRELDAVRCCEDHCQHPASDFETKRCCGIERALDTYPPNGSLARVAPTPIVTCDRLLVVDLIRAGLDRPTTIPSRARSSPVYLLNRSLRI